MANLYVPPASGVWQPCANFFYRYFFLVPFRPRNGNAGETSDAFDPKSTQPDLPKPITWIVALSRLVLIFTFFTVATPLFGVVPAFVGPATGTPAFGSYSNGPDKINLGNLNVNLTIPLFVKAGRGINYEYDLTYDSSLWTNGGSAGKNWDDTSLHYGWRVGIPQAVGGSVAANKVAVLCQQGPNAVLNKFTFSNFSYISPDGVVNTFEGTSTWNQCTNERTPLSATSPYGYLLNIQGQVGNANGTLTDPSGNTIQVSIAPNVGQQYLDNISARDRNGNSMGFVAPGSSPYRNYGDTAGVIPLAVTSDMQFTAFGITSDSGMPATLQYIDSNGNSQTITIQYQSFNIQTAFGISGIDEYSGVTYNLPVAVLYPDGTSYKFTYEQTPGLGSGYVTGRIASITLPTGGTISYAYVDGSNGIESDGSTSGIIRTTSDGQTRYDRSNVTLATTSSNGSSTTTITDASTNQTVLSFVELAGTYNFYENSRKVYSGSASGNPLRTVTTCYNSTSLNCNSDALTVPFTEVYQTSALENGLTSATDTLFNSIGAISSAAEYNYGATTPTRKTITAYASLGNNILDRPSSVTIQDGGGNQISSTTYGYDESAVTATSGLPNHSAVSGSRGNQTSIHRWLNISNNTLNSYLTYDDAGQVVSSQDARGNSTQYAYDTPTDTCLIKTTAPTLSSGVAISSSRTCDPNTGLVTNSTDANGHITTYSYDAMLHPAVTAYPDGGRTTVDYSGASLPEVVTTSVSASPSPDEVSSVTLDGYGRVSESVGSGGAIVGTTYDNMGRVGSVTNPHFSSKTSTDGTTTYGYDALGRKILQTQPDGFSQQWTYSGNQTSFKDEESHTWTRVSDAFGRLTNVVEPTGTSTVYTYDLLNNLRNATQNGASGETPRVRSFVYDSLSRLTSSTNPETGTIGYSYDANGNLFTKTDGRGITTNYVYDALNRLTFKHYSDGTATAAFGYDGKSETGATLPVSVANAIGRLSVSSNQVNVATIYSYDPVGRVSQQNYCIPSSTCSYGIEASATYDLAGNMTSQTYPDGRTLSQGFDGAGRESSITYTGWNGNGHSTPYLTVASYDPESHLTNATMGNSLGTQAAYDSRGRIQSLLYGTSTNLLWGKNYQWYPNSNLQSYTDAYTGIGRQFTYDNLNRILSAQDIVGSFSGSWSVPSGSSSTGSSSGATPTPFWTDPDDSNLLVNPNEPGSFGWSQNAITFQSGITAPDGTSSAYNMVAAAGVSTDGWVGDGTGAISYSGETMTASVWLRSANGPHTVSLYMLEFDGAGSAAGIAASTAVTVTTNWQQFSLSGRVEQNLGTLYLQIGGAGSISNGQVISIWNPMMEDSGVSGTTVTNFMTYSQRFTQPVWQRTSGLSIVDNSAAAPAPDGTNTASLVTASAGSSESYFVGGIANPTPYTGLPVTASIWLRSVTGTQNMLLTLLSLSTNGISTMANSTVTLTTTWQRFALTGTQTTLTPLSFQVGGADTFLSGDAFLAWGAQIELASNAGPYIATGASQASAGTSLTNVLPYSQQPNGPSWNVAGTQIALAAVVGPDGSGTGTQVTAQANQNDAYITNDVPNPTLYDGANVTGSVFLRVASGTQTVNLAFGADAPGRVYVGLQTVTLNSSWQRFTISGQLPNGLNRLFLQVGGGGSFSSGQSFDIWGTQVEVSPNAGPYVMTSALPVISGQELTNILPSSQQLNGPGWQTQFGSVAVNYATAPDGSTTAALFTADPTSADSYIVDYVSNPSLYDSQTVTASVYLRVASGTLNSVLYLNNVGDAGWQIQQSAPITVTTTWQRFSVTATNQNGLTLLYLQIGGADTINSGQSIQIWGAQMAVGDSPAPYTPTTNGTTSVANGAPATLLQNGLNQTFSYDSFGNLLQNGGFNNSYTAQNQMFGYTYDAAGNLLSNYLTTMTWDAESKLISAGGATYVYDADGNRVEKQGVGVTDTIFFGGRPIARYTGGSWTDLIYGPNGMFAEVAGTESASPNYRLLDHLGNQVGTVGSTILLTDPLDYAPFGQAFSGSTNDPYMFTGKERDQESGLDYFGARYYASNMGRFMSPDYNDIDDGPDPIPYANPRNPQSLNLYTYVGNNPVSNVDDDGHYLEASSGSDNSGGALPAGTCTGIIGCVAGFLKNLAGDILGGGGPGPGTLPLTAFSFGVHSTVVGIITYNKASNIIQQHPIASNIIGNAALILGTDGLGPEVQAGSEAIESVGTTLSEIRFGNNANQDYHAFRHIEEAGLDKQAIKNAIEKDLSHVKDSLPGGLKKGTVEVGGKTVDYHAFKLPDGTINVGRITVR